MADLQATPIKNKFIFTNEGRRMLTAQLNGIRFAILGAILVQGIEPIELTDEDKQRNPIDDEGHSTSPFYNTMRTLNLEELIQTLSIAILRALPQVNLHIESFNTYCFLSGCINNS